MGVTVEAFVSQGTVLGPLPTTWIIMDIGSLIGHMTADNFGHTSQVKIDVAQSVGNPSQLLEWILYVNCARLDDEQNLEVLETEMGLFYRITRDVQPGEQLLLWYSEDLQSRLGLAKIKAGAQSAPYRCTCCGEAFQYPNPYVCHVRFKCASKADSEASLGSSVNNNNNEDRQVHTPRPGSKRGSAVGDEVAPAKRPCIEQPAPPYGPLVPDLALATAAAQLATYQQLVQLALASMQLPPPTLVPPLLMPFQPNPGAEPVRSERTTPPSSRRLEREMHTRAAPGSSPTLPEAPRCPNFDSRPASGRAPLPSAPPRGGPSPAGNSLPSFKAHNPVVDEVLKGLAQPAPDSPNLLAFSMLQNWCAKCNQVFRMTNDLVHHMRVYHRNAKDEKITPPDRAAALRGHSDPANSAFEPPAPAKREEKLRCNICGERFRERHHLSRHLTSHE